jgi:hypothetical protein
MATNRENSGRFTRIPGVDPYVDWAYGPGWHLFFLEGRQQQWVSVLLMLADLSVEEFAAGEGFVDPAEADQWKAAVRVTTLYQPREPSPGGIRFVTALVTEHFFEILEANVVLQKHVVRVTLGRPLDAESLPFLHSDGGALK